MIELLTGKWLPITGSELIARERIRQIETEGWSDQHDDEHDEGDLTMAAICYATSAVDVEIFVKHAWADSLEFHDPWPWAKKDDARDIHDKLKKLIIAGALIAAEIDRLLRNKELSDD